MPCTYMYACKTRGNPCLHQSLAFASGAGGADRGMMQLHRVRTEWSSALPSAGSDANFARSTARDLRWYFCGPPTACVHTLPFGLHMPKKEGGRRRNGNKEMNEKTKTNKKYDTLHGGALRIHARRKYTSTGLLFVALQMFRRNGLHPLLLSMHSYKIRTKFKIHVNVIKWVLKYCNPLFRELLQRYRQLVCTCTHCVRVCCSPFQKGTDRCP